MRSAIVLSFEEDRSAFLDRACAPQFRGRVEGRLLAYSRIDKSGFEVLIFTVSKFGQPLTC
jgi:hypothetical protein